MQKYSEDYTSEIENIAKHSNAKKYVFSIDSDFVEYFDSLSKDEKNTLINNLINEFAKKQVREKGQKEIIAMGVKILAIIFIVPLILYGINFALVKSYQGFDEMKSNFERLYNHHGK